MIYTIPRHSRSTPIRTWEFARVWNPFIGNLGRKGLVWHKENSARSSIVVIIGKHFTLDHIKPVCLVKQIIFQINLFHFNEAFH